MALKNVFDQSIAQEVVDRVNLLTPSSKPQWGTMSVAQMLAHCNVTYEMVYEDKHPKPGFFMKFILKSLVKKKVTDEIPYKQSERTAQQFLVANDKDFGAEKQRLIDHIYKTQQLGATHFNGKESHSFGKLNAMEWNNMFYKHLDHHLRQFGV